MKLHDNVTVYDRYRFAIPVTGIIRKFAKENDGVEVQLTKTNHWKWPVGETIWVSVKQLRLVEESQS